VSIITGRANANLNGCRFGEQCLHYFGLVLPVPYNIGPSPDNSYSRLILVVGDIEQPQSVVGKSFHCNFLKKFFTTCIRVIVGSALKNLKSQVAVIAHCWRHLPVLYAASRLDSSHYNRTPWPLFPPRSISPVP
jgi:hypothetical protein